MEWKAGLYQEKHGFVAEYGKDLLRYVNTDPGQRILDLGCGTGTLTARLAEQGGRVTGVDASEAMLEQARRNYPDLEFQRADAAALPFEGCFDTVFSNAVFHWISDQETLLAGVRRALRPGGRLVFEMGAAGNNRLIREACAQVYARHGGAYRTPWFFPTAEEYRTLLEGAGLIPERLVEFDRPTPLKDGAMGLRNWLEQFCADSLCAFAPEEREAVLAELEERLRPALWDGTQWVADYRRLRGVAMKP